MSIIDERSSQYLAEAIRVKKIAEKKKVLIVDSYRSGYMQALMDVQRAETEANERIENMGDDKNG